MVTLEQLLSRAGDELHYTGSGPCKRTVGPRGGVTEHVVRVRPNGRVKTWKTRPGQLALRTSTGYGRAISFGSVSGKRAIITSRQSVR